MSNIFVSYSRRDKKWLDYFLNHAKMLNRLDRISFWTDRDIKPSERWNEIISDAIDKSEIFIFIVTQNLIASDFVYNIELPKALKKQQEGLARVFWLLAEPADWKSTPFLEIQAANDLSKPLSQLDKATRDETMVEVVNKLRNMLTLSAVASGFDGIDMTTRSMESIISGNTQIEEETYGVSSSIEQDRETISFKSGGNTISSISYNELAELPDEDHEFILSHEETMKANFSRYLAVRKRLDNGGGALEGEIRDEMTRISKRVCEDLFVILDFLTTIHQYRLEDHYGRYRYLCNQITDRFK